MEKGRREGETVGGREKGKKERGGGEKGREDETGE